MDERPLSDASDSEINALVDEVLRSGKHMTLPVAEDGGSEERFHARAIAQHMERLAQQINGGARDGEEPPEDVDEWWFEVDGRRIGPLSLRKVRYLWEEGELTPDTLCWHTGLTNWVYLFKVSELAHALAPKPAPKVVSPPIDPEPESGPSWKPSAGPALEEENRKLLEPAKPGPGLPPPVEYKPPPQAIDPGDPTLLAVPTIDPKSGAARPRLQIGNAVVSGLVSGLIIVGALWLTRGMWLSDVPAPRRETGSTPPATVATTITPPPPPPAERPAPEPPPPASRAAPKETRVSDKSSPRVVTRQSTPKPGPAPTPAPEPAPKPAATTTSEEPKSVEEAFLETFSPKDELETSEIMEVAIRNKWDVEQCVAEYKKTAPDSNGRIVMRWEVSLDGAVSKVAAARPDPALASLEACLVEVIQGWRFPKHEVPHGPVEFPFVY